jgi:hypothetical protein
MAGNKSKMPEFRDEMELQDTGQYGWQRFRKPLLYPNELLAQPDCRHLQQWQVHFSGAIYRLGPGTPAARDLLARPRRFERPNFAAGAFTHHPTSKIRPVAAGRRFVY